MLGPKLGAFHYTTSFETGWDSGIAPIDHSYDGLAYGLNVGIFGAARNVGLGVLLGYTFRHEVTGCPTRVGDSPDCPQSKTDLKLLAIAVAALF